MKLNYLLKGIEVINTIGNKYIDIDSITYDSKQVRPGALFFAIKGCKLNGFDFIDEAIERGAVCVVSDAEFITYKSICKVLVKDIRAACAQMADNFYEQPSGKIDVTGITGTNGKTTIMYLVEAILYQAGRKCGTIGTISYNIGERRIPAVNTTPSAIMLQMFLNDMVKANISNCVMEVSSHSLHQHRVDGIRYKSAIFSNLSREHLDYHKDMEAYFTSKQRLFETLQEDSDAIINIDDDYGKRIASSAKARVMTYGIKEEADVRAFDIKTSINGSLFKVKTPSRELNLKTRLIGRYNIYNMLAAISFGLAKGINSRSIEDALRVFKGTPGRLQRIETGGDFSVFVDYAHTDDALANVLSTLKELVEKRIIVLFGCGGDRDKGKRPRMAKVAQELADFVLITNDNPRTEDPKQIIDDISKGLSDGFKDYKVISDRRKAIETALNMAESGDIVLLAGKGHEKYQILKDTTIAFDDCKVAEEVLNSKDIPEKV